MKKILLFISLSIFMSINVWAQTAGSISENQAIEIAQEYALQNNYKPEEWLNTAKVRAFFDEGKKVWIVYFSAKPNEEGFLLVGDHFSIYISDQGVITNTVGGE